MPTEQSKSKLREGFTTGTAAAAAACACTILPTPSNINVELPSGAVSIPISLIDGKIGVIKDSGDDPDVTNGIFIYTDVELTAEDSRISIDGGAGIGIVTRKGLQIPVGEAAINPGPRKIIETNIRRFLPDGCGAKITIHAQDGDKIAGKTFNSRLGIQGGISILGTSGIVRPMSNEALIKSIKCEIDVLHAEKRGFIWLVPGQIGENALHKLIPDAASVQFSNYAGEALEYLRCKGYDKGGIAGHPGKLAKIAMGSYNTHSAQSPQANSFIAELFGIENNFNTIEELCIPANNEKFSRLAEIISAKICFDLEFKAMKVILFSMEGKCTGKSYE